MPFWEEGAYTHYPTEGVGGEGSKDLISRDHSKNACTV